MTRHCRRATSLPVGGGPDGKQPIAVMPGDIAHISFAAIHRDPNIWGPDANEFRPERWGDDKLRPTWEYLPFGGGPRICPAQSLSLYWVTYTIARMVMRFERLENAETDEDNVRRIGFHIGPKHGLKVVLVPATS